MALPIEIDWGADLQSGEYQTDKNIYQTEYHDDRDGREQGRQRLS